MSLPQALTKTQSSFRQISAFDLARKLMVVYWEIGNVTKSGSLSALSGRYQGTGVQNAPVQPPDQLGVFS